VVEVEVGAVIYKDEEEEDDGRRRRWEGSS